ncbi:hypothetical protein ACIBFB_26625 [Nocardiopsis sp. NPDC050513]|uniref:hypothetical protein n=1 Tax=Nocardiopsis sp. NPDC050513 TaxID=3364338 RepID=UPI0037A47262
MARSRTPHALRALAARFRDRHPGCRMDADHEGGQTWILSWRDGPSLQRVEEAAAAAAPHAQVGAHRSYSPRAWALAAIEACLQGRTGPRPGDGSALARQVEGALAQAEDPDHAGDARRAAMAEALIRACEDPAYEDRLLAPVAKEGLAWLLTPYEAATTDAPLAMGPAEHLTARYARGADEGEWTHRLRALPAPVLVQRAGADPGLDRAGRLAVLGLLEEMRALWAATEGAAIAAARDAGAPGGRASWSQIGAALGGISKQGAQDRARRREKGGAVRLR